MKRYCLTTGLALSFLVCSLGVARAQNAETKTEGILPPGTIVTNTVPTVQAMAAKMVPGRIIVPQSSVPPLTQGTTNKTRMMQTDLEIFLPAGWKADQEIPPGPYYTPAPPYAGYAYETPASLGCLYALTAVVTGCNPNTVTTPPTGGSKSIAIVDAYDDPFAGPDLAYFSSQFGLPFDPPQLQVVYEDGIEPTVDTTGGWEMEESLDIEYAHAMAPNATIYLVEAQSAALSDLLASVQIAKNLVQCGLQTTCGTVTGSGEVSMSWGGAEYSTETSNDSVFTGTGVVYVASSGDDPGTYWPCTSPNVVCTGGSTTRRNINNGNFINEGAWSLAGGGVSRYEARPSYQSSISTTVGAARGVPDVALDSNPVTGVWVYDSFGYALDYFDPSLANAGWEIVGGTSAASPMWAGILNNAATRNSSFAASTSAELTTMYTNKAVTTDFRDVVLGQCGPYNGLTSATGWDFCTGIGSDQGYTGK